MPTLNNACLSYLIQTAMYSIIILKGVVSTVVYTQMNHSLLKLIDFHLLPRAHVRSRGRVIVLSVGRSVCLSVCLSAPSQDFKQNRLVYQWALLAT